MQVKKPSQRNEKMKKKKNVVSLIEMIKTHELNIKIDKILYTLRKTANRPAVLYCNYFRFFPALPYCCASFSVCKHHEIISA